ncbi:MAG: TetR/AcrR family transcriptional regulator [Anaerolineae bacterium]
MTTPHLHHRRRTINKDDPRVQRTVKLLGDTLLSLVVEKGYEPVTIQDITDRANVSRTTFYLHFKDKDELLFECMREMYDDLARTMQTIDFANREAALQQLRTPSDFEHVKRYFEFYKVMLSDKGSITFLLRVLTYLGEAGIEVFQASLEGHATPRVPIPVIAYMSAGAEIGLMTWWVTQNMPYTPEAMAHYLCDAQMNGLWWALGVEGV